MSRAAHLPAHEAHRDAVGARIGMWLFLLTELLLFGGLFLLYAVYRTTFTRDFHFAAATLDVTAGTVNTLILLTSSLTMVLAIGAIAHGRRRTSAALLALTMLAGLAFLAIKYFEWSAKFHHGLYPNSPELLRHTPGENVFYGLYFMMTGLHGLHVLVGIGVLGVMLVLVWRRPRRTYRLGPADRVPVTLGREGELRWTPEVAGRVTEARVTVLYREDRGVNDGLFIKLENAGLYWHLVDVIWIFLFPLFYLIS